MLDNLALRRIHHRYSHSRSPRNNLMRVEWVRIKRPERMQRIPNGPLDDTSSIGTRQTTFGQAPHFLSIDDFDIIDLTRAVSHSHCAIRPEPLGSMCLICCIPGERYGGA